MKKWWWLIKRLLVYVPLSAALFLFHIFVNKYLLVLTDLFDYPKPTIISSQFSNYDLDSFGAPIKAGFSKRDITPGRFSWVAGFYPPHPALSVKNKIQVKSLAFQDKRGKTIVIVSCDLIGLLSDERKEIFSRVKNVDKNNIFLSATHTHSGPDVIGLWGGKNRKYMEFLRSEVSSSIDESVLGLHSAALRFGKGTAPGLAEGRNENPADPTVGIIQVFISKKHGGRNEGTLVTLVNFASHADVTQGFQISSDFPYFLEERLRMRIGSETMFIPGAIGGVQPIGDRKELTYLVRTLGENLGDIVIDAMKNPIIPESVEIGSEKNLIKAPFENRQELYWAVRSGMVANLLNKENQVETEVTKITIGPAEILTIPGELFPKIWWRAKSKMTGRVNMAFGLTNGFFGYIMLPEDIASGEHNYHKSLSIGPTFGKEIDKALQEFVK